MQLYPAVTEQITVNQLMAALQVENIEPFARYLTLVTNHREAEGRTAVNFRTLPDYAIGITQAFLECARLADPHHKHVYLGRAQGEARSALSTLEKLLENGSKDQHDYRQGLVSAMIQCVHDDIGIPFLLAMGKPGETPYFGGQVNACIAKHRGLSPHAAEEGMPMNPLFYEFNHRYLNRNPNRAVYEEALELFREYGIFRRHWLQVPIQDFNRFYDRARELLLRIDFKDVFGDSDRIISKKHQYRAKELQSYYHKPDDFTRVMVDADFSIQKVSLGDVRYVVTAMEKDHLSLQRIYSLIDGCAFIQTHSAFVRSRSKKFVMPV